MSSFEEVFRSVFGHGPGPGGREREGELRLFPGLAVGDLAPGSKEAELFDSLPPEHRRLLGASNGLDLQGASYRLFGFGHSEVTDLPLWNHPETWKFAWQGRADPYLSFGQSALGNQFAYRLDELGRPGPVPVYELYAVTLDPVETFASLETFFTATFLQPGQTAYHQRIETERGARGGFGHDELLVYNPSPLLVGGRVDVGALYLMDACQAMILQGDIAVQLGSRGSSVGLERLEPWIDEAGRERLRLIWSPSG